MSGSVTTRRVCPVMSIETMYSGPSQSDTNVPFTADQSSDRPANHPGSVSKVEPSRSVTIMKGAPWVSAATRPVGTTLARTVSVNPSALTATDPRPNAAPVALPGEELDGQRRLEGREHGVGHSGARHDSPARARAARVAARGEAERETEDEGAGAETRAGDDHGGAA